MTPDSFFFQVVSISQSQFTWSDMSRPIKAHLLTLSA